MSLGKTIKRLRREKGITQEQLAESIGITSRAVSGWECDRTAPDISHVPLLCRIFEVSADELLGIDLEHSESEIRAYLDEAETLGHTGQGEERTALLREANRRFPREWRIMLRLADSIVCENSRKNRQEYDEVFALCRRILSESTDSAIRYEAIETLACACDYAGKREEMLRLAEEMPRAHLSREHFMLYRWRGDRDFSERQAYTCYLIHQLLEALFSAPAHRHDDGNSIFFEKEQRRLLETVPALLALLFPDGDYQYAAQYGEIASSQLMIRSVRSGDLSDAWLWLERAADFACHMDTYDFDAAHSSPALKGYVDGGWIPEAGGNRSANLLRWLEGDKEAAPIRSDARYPALAKRLQMVGENK